MAQTDEEILNELKMAEIKSTLKVGLGLGNKIFSTHNNALNAKQSENKIVLTPSLGYFHKSGFSLSAAGYFLDSKRTNGLLQYAINPAYDYTSGKCINASLSYTHYIATNKYNTSVTPIQNDFFLGINSKKGWLKPGIQMGYAFGNYKDIVHVDTTVRNAGINVHYSFIDTSTTKLKLFSITGTLEHTFKFVNLFSPKDAFNFIPELIVNFGSDNYKTVQSSSGSYSYLVKHGRDKKRKDFKNEYLSNYKTKFTLESLGLNLGADYGIGKCIIQPNIYLDYYIPSTNFKRLIKIYSINFSYNF